MGSAALHAKLHGCDRKLDGLQQQKEYAVAASGAQIEKSNSTVASMTSQLEGMRKSLAGKRNASAVEMQQLTREIHDLTLNTSDLKAAYNREFAEWYRVKNEVTRKTASIASCNCHQKSFLFQRKQLQGEQQGASRSSNVYDLVHQVQECERKVGEVEAVIQAAEAASQNAGIQAVVKVEGLKRSMADQQHMHKILSRKSRVKDLVKTEKTMLETVEHLRSQVESYTAAKKKMENLLAQLTEEMKACGCSS